MSARPPMLALLVDGLNLVRRVHAAVPGEPGSGAHPDDVMTSCRRSLARAVDQLAPTHAVCVFDGLGETWRHRLLPEYKADRPAMPEDLQALLGRIEDAFREIGVDSLRVPGLEADDVLASVATRIADRGGEAVILSTDKSMLSLLRPGIRVRNHFEGRYLDANHVRERFGVEPVQLPDYLALVGERSQGIPGVRGIGAKTAATLLAAHAGLDAVLESAPGMDGRAGKSLVAEAEVARLSLRLATLRADVEVGTNLSRFRLDRP